MNNQQKAQYCCCSFSGTPPQIVKKVLIFDQTFSIITFIIVLGFLIYYIASDFYVCYFESWGCPLRSHFIERSVPILICTGLVHMILFILSAVELCNLNNRVQHGNLKGLRCYSVCRLVGLIVSLIGCLIVSYWIYERFWFLMKNWDDASQENKYVVSIGVNCAILVIQKILIIQQFFVLCPLFTACEAAETPIGNERPAQVVDVQQHPDAKNARVPVNYVHPQPMGMSTNGGQGTQMVTPNRAYNNGNEGEW